MFARNTDPETSHDAVNPTSAAILRELVVDTLKSIGSHGGTSEEIAAKLNLGRDSISPRMKGLVEDGIVAASGKRPGRSGRGQTVWVLAPAA